MRLLPALSRADGVDYIAAATSLSGAFWQMATPVSRSRPSIAAIHSFPTPWPMSNPTPWSMSKRVFSDC